MNIGLPQHANTRKLNGLADIAEYHSTERLIFQFSFEPAKHVLEK